MKVRIVSYCYPYEGADIVGVYATAAAAERAMADAKKEEPSSFLLWEVEEREVEE